MDLLLLMGTNRLCGFPPFPRRAAVAALLGGVHAGACFLPGFGFLCNNLWRVVCLGLICWIAFGLSKSAMRRAAVYVLLTMALGGITTGIGNGGAWSLVASAGLLFLFCAFGFRDRPGSVTYVPVELRYGEKHLRLLALQDTGNTLRDPVTGRPVLVVDAQTANNLTGLSHQQLSCPLDAMKQLTLPGLRLVPYHSVGQDTGLLLALQLQDVTIGKWRGSSLVAFAPGGLSREGAYQALTGGAV